jgi:hypothetical protein
VGAPAEGAPGEDGLAGCDPEDGDPGDGLLSDEGRDPDAKQPPSCAAAMSAMASLVNG